MSTVSTTYLLFSHSADEEDYVPLLNLPLTIPAGSVVGDSFCITFQARGDEIREPDQMLTINLQVENSLDAVSAPTSVTITILADQDSELELSLLASRSTVTGGVLIEFGSALRLFRVK